MPPPKACVVAWLRDQSATGQQVMEPVTCLEAETLLIGVIHKLATGGELTWFEQALVDTVIKSSDDPMVAVEVRRMW